MNCTFELCPGCITHRQGDGHLFFCTQCDYRTTIRRKRPPRRNCPASTPGLTPGSTPGLAEQQPPTFPEKLLRYGVAVAKWVTAGRPVRTDAEVLQILNDHCRPCELFNGVNCTHKRCGCRVNEGGHAMTNKIKMATEHCPMLEW
ncbi:hypothetical protein [Lignipirellula cremea]|uniref:Uncharacterized protein n=1 Tax=Lignipirellula cremea TaxID=2528010 RepID=A0A518E0D3_9BACT|nr:hypothetical protein [Lignipirellula cremea]QDU97545.1 hypothetical protein Pla8534_53930 [Lignipirellula cremea]